MFSLSKEQNKKVNDWLHTSVYPPIVARQLADPAMAPHVFTTEDGITWPYFGACGGDLTYSFTPTSLGIITKVTHASGAELDVTEYDYW